SAAEVGAVNKGMGLFATIIGVVFGGALMVRLTLYRALIVFGLLQAVSNLLYMLVALVGHDYAVMTLAVASDNICGGMGTTAFVALLMALCNARFTATQFALLSALSAVGRVYVGPVAGYLTDPTGLGMAWAPFFFLTFLAALPGVAMVWWMRQTIESLGQRPTTG
ncbi:MAG: muropeptide MFS transporter AmpG, partial [Betaproteobacteria bacterium]|nr:muropeptide MFS transporter AmpG [Betaproteobacteria bacterium]